MGGAGVSVELDLCSWGRMLKSDSVKEGLLVLLLLSPRENGTFLHQVGQRLEYSRGFGQERPEEVEQTQELAYILFTSGLRIVSDGRCMFPRRSDAAGTDYMAQELQLRGEKFGLGCVDSQAGLAQALEYLAQVSAVLLLVLGTNQNVIQINKKISRSPKIESIRR